MQMLEQCNLERVILQKQMDKKVVEDQLVMIGFKLRK
nr:MAG TPA: hypothetical protein [Caudoviricetes sp.]